MKAPRLPKTATGRALVAFPVAIAVGLLLWLHGPSWSAVGAAFTAVAWKWVAAAIALNLLSVVTRALAWNTVIRQAMAAPHPSALLVFSAFSVGLFANAVLPGRIGELARVAVLTRKLPGRKGAWATLVGTVFAHRLFDLVPVLLLILYVVLTAKVPSWAVSVLLGVIAAGTILFAFGFVSARRHHATRLDSTGVVKRMLTMARQGLGVMRTPLGFALAVSFQILGWVCQIFAVWAAMRAFDIHAPLPAAGIVLLVMNVVTIFPFWPGNIGALQVAIATALVSYNVAYARGIAYGFGLQAIEASVGVGVGLLFLAREGLSFAMLKVMPTAAQAEMDDQSDEDTEPDAELERARVPG